MLLLNDSKEEKSDQEKSCFLTTNNEKNCLQRKMFHSAYHFSMNFLAFSLYTQWLVDLLHVRWTLWHHCWKQQVIENWKEASDYIYRRAFIKNFWNGNIMKILLYSLCEKCLRNKNYHRLPTFNKMPIRNLSLSYL